MTRPNRRDFLKLTGAATTAGVAGIGGVQMARAASGRAPATIAVGGVPMGKSIENSGVVGKRTRFDINDLLDLGVKNYRFYTSFGVWEHQDDDGDHGSPSIARIKDDPNEVNWAHWDAVMPNPYTGQNILPWIQQMNQHGIEPILSMSIHGAAWMMDNYNPPVTQAGRNEWWEHIFAIAYWLNVRNDYRVDRWQVLNEVNLQSESHWRGTKEEYADLVALTHDAIDHVYKTYLPRGREYHIHAPVVALNRNIDFPENAGYQYIKTALASAGDAFDTLDYHDYSGGPLSRARNVRQLAHEGGYPDRDLWVSEWNQATLGRDPDLNTKVRTGLHIMRYMIGFSQPDTYVRGATLMSLYTNPDNGLPRLINVDGSRNPPYYGFRMANRALQGGKTTFRTTPSTNDLVTLTTRDDEGTIWALIANRAKEGTTTYDIDLDLSALRRTGTAKVWRYSENNLDEVTGTRTVTNGHVQVGWGRTRRH